MSLALVQIDGREGAKFEATRICAEAMPDGFFAKMCASQLPKSKDEYSKFIINELPAIITTDHVLIVQSDGYITNPELWDDSWLQYDYIGAPWPFPPYVGNGGFSLRSRKLLEACRGFYEEGVAEDIVICSKRREELIARGIKFAPLEVAARFSRELVHPGHPTFGFHGVHEFMCICGGVKELPNAPCCSACCAELPEDLEDITVLDTLSGRCAIVDWLRLNPRPKVA